MLHYGNKPLWIQQEQRPREQASLDYFTIRKRQTGSFIIITVGYIASSSVLGGSVSVFTGSQWHPFYDSSGIMYYYNFSSRIRMRGSLLDPSSSRSRDDDNDESDDEQTSSEEDSTVV